MLQQVVHIASTEIEVLSCILPRVVLKVMDPGCAYRIALDKLN